MAVNKKVVDRLYYFGVCVHAVVKSYTTSLSCLGWNFNDVNCAYYWNEGHGGDQPFVSTCAAFVGTFIASVSIPRRVCV